MIAWAQVAASYAVDPKTGAFAIQLGQCPCLARVCVVCHKQETGPLHECEMDQKRVDAAAAEAAAKAAAAPVDKASEQYMASIGKRCGPDCIACRCLRAYRSIHRGSCV